MSDDNINGLDKPTQQAIGMRLEEMYHTATSIHDMTAQLIGNGNNDASVLWAIQELARGQARDLEALAERLQDCEIGYFADHYKDPSLV